MSAAPGRASARATVGRTLARLLLIETGFLTMAVGMVMSMNARLGVSAWHVLHLGLARQLPLTVGQATQGVGLLIIAGAAALGIKPRLGTWLNMVFVGTFIDLVLGADLVPAPAELGGRMVLCVGGVAVTTLGMCLYMGAGMGAGPRDSLMLALGQRLRGRIGLVRTALELTALTTGYLMGGPIGAGTLLSALLLGWFLEGWFLLVLWSHRRWPALTLLTVPPTIAARLERRRLGAGRPATGVAGGAPGR